MGLFMIGDPCLWNLTWGGVNPEPVSTFSANGVPWKHQSRERQAGTACQRGLMTLIVAGS